MVVVVTTALLVVPITAGAVVSTIVLEIAVTHVEIQRSEDNY